MCSRDSFLFAEHLIFTMETELDTPVFLHGLWRSQTTYWWSKFRSDENNRCLNEPLHHDLQTMKKKSEFSSKRLRHPQLSEPPFAEYPLDVLSAGDLSIKKYYLHPEEEDPDLEHHLRSLMDLDGRTVFKIVRGTLRAEWMAQKLGGVHIYIDRDLPSLMNSYYSFRGGLSWYLSEFVTIVGANADHQKLRELADYLQLEKVDGDHSLLRAHYTKLTRQRVTEKIYTRQEFTDVVAFFRELSLDQAQRYADMIVTPADMSDLKRKAEIEEKVLELTGTKVDFTDYQHKVKEEKVPPSSQILSIIERAKENY